MQNAPAAVVRRGGERAGDDHERGPAAAGVYLPRRPRDRWFRAKNARDILEHFDEYARGDRQLQRKAMNELGIDVFEAAAMFWGGGYDPATEELTEGPFVVAISQAVETSQRLHMAIYRAARPVDASRRLA
jgi:hypothetical protein